MLARVDSRDLAEMEADYAIEPWGEFRSDLQAGIVAAAAANAFGGGKAKPVDFMPKWAIEEKETPTGTAPASLVEKIKSNLATLAQKLSAKPKQ